MKHVSDSDLTRWRDEARSEAMTLIAELGDEYTLLPEPEWRRVQLLAERLADAATRAQVPATVDHLLRVYSLTPRHDEPSR